jgi:hypothetical protein
MMVSHCRRDSMAGMKALILHVVAYNSIDRELMDDYPVADDTRACRYPVFDPKVFSQDHCSDRVCSGPYRGQIPVGLISV